MIRDMATKELKMRKHPDGSYFTRWYDENRKWHFRRFGTNYSKAYSKFSQFYHQWRKDPSVRLGIEHEVMTMERLWGIYEPYAKSYYVKPDGSQTREATNLKHAFSHALALFKDLPVEKFRATQLKQVRESMEEAIKPGGGPKYTRTVINQRIAKIRQIMKWGVSEEYVPAEVLVSLQSVKALARGRTQAREKQKPGPVDEIYVNQVCEHATPILRAMIHLQWLTGMRPGELVIMRPCDIDMTGDVWQYRPPTHKNAYREQSRVVCIGPNAQQHIEPYLNTMIDQCIFSPKIAMSERYEQCETHRREKQQPTPRKTTRTLNDHYTTCTYAQAIKRICEAHNIMHWSPNLLRHNYITEVRKRLGLEHAQAVAGHARQTTTEIYASDLHPKAIEAALIMG